MNKYTNQHWLREKKLRKLEAALDQNYDAQRNLGYVKLEEPIPNGYYAYFVLHPDVDNQAGSWIFRRIINLCCKRAWAKHKNHFYSKKRLKDNIEYVMPAWKDITPTEYHQLPFKAKKWFQPVNSGGSGWQNYTVYRPNLPESFFQIKIVKTFITHYRVKDEVLEQEEAELSREIGYMKDKYGLKYERNKAPKAYVNGYNRTHRAQEKEALHNLLHKGMENAEFPGRHRHCANYDYW